MWPLCVVEHPPLLDQHLCLFTFCPDEKCSRNRVSVLDESNQPQSFEWAESRGFLPKEWNFLVGYSAPMRDVKLVHYTQGVPGYKECRDCEYADEWFREKEIVSSHVSWLEIMGHSVHARPVLKKLQGGS